MPQLSFTTPFSLLSPSLIWSYWTICKYIQVCANCNTQLDMDSNHRPACEFWFNLYEPNMWLFYKPYVLHEGCNCLPYLVRFHHAPAFHPAMLLLWNWLINYPVFLILECKRLGGSKSSFPLNLQDIEPYRAWSSIGLVPLFKRERETSECALFLFLFLSLSAHAQKKNYVMTQRKGVIWKSER